MNKQRRIRIEVVQLKLEEILAELNTIMDEEQEAFDAMPESIQSSERGEKIEAGIYNLQCALDGIESINDELNEAKE